MLIVGESLQQLNAEYKIVNNSECFDTNSLTLHLDKTIIRIKKVTSVNCLIYGEGIPAECTQEMVIRDGGIVIPSNSALLACSTETVKIPKGYFGFLQTKGSLARYFVSVHFCDGQVDPGYEGKVTFEIFNGSCYDIKLHKNQPIASLFIFNTSSKNNDLYKGRYNHAKKPTLPCEMS